MYYFTTKFIVVAMTQYALITGASKGIGKAMAFALAKSGYHLLLIARSEDELHELSVLINKQHQVTVLYLVMDLSTYGTAMKVADWVVQHKINLSILINNAGYGIWGDFEHLSLAAQINMIQLNIQAVLELTHHLLSILKQQPQAYILNVSSTAAYQAIPTMAVYAASKSFMLAYTRALRYELKNSPVSVSCLCPGPTATGFSDRAGLNALADLAEKFNMSAEVVALSGIKGMFRKKAEIVPGFLNKLSAAGAQLLPKHLIERITANLYKR